MINIQEIQPPIKVSGISSFVVSFDYKESIVEALKTMPNFYYHKKLKLWEIPSNCVSQLLDTLTFLDDIQIQFINNSENTEISEITKPLTTDEIAKFKYKPFTHQIEAINFGLRKPKWLLLDSMGVGKTNEIIWLAESLKRRGIIQHCFIVCGVNALKQNWKKEINKFSTESCMVLGEKVSKKGKISYMSVADRAKQLKGPIEEFFIITNVETLRDDRIIDAFKTSENKFGMIAIDEVHRCLTGNTKINTSAGIMTIKELNALPASQYPAVLSYNTKSKKDEYQKIEDVVQLEPFENILELTIADSDKTYVLQCTESHKIYTNNRGWVKAKDLVEDDDIKIIS